MNIQIHIECDGTLEILEHRSGITQPPTDRRKVIYGITKQNQITLHLEENAEWVALLRLIDFLRAITDRPTTIYSSNRNLDDTQQAKAPKYYEDSAELFLYLGRLCLFSFEHAEKNKFASHLSIFPANAALSDSLPFLFLNLGQIPHGNEPTALALKKINPEIMAHASLFMLDARHLCKPTNIADICAYPEQIDKIEYIEFMQSAYGRWIDLVARVSLSIRQPLLQFGTIQDSASDEIQFYRAIIPFASLQERPQNFRIMILSYFPQQQIWGL